MDTPTYVITLVHGTFARDAEWIRPESAFSELIRRELAEPSLIKSFQWSGDNNHQARFSGAKDLVAQVSSTIAEYPHCRHFVVAHSHGGNLALAAQGDWSIKGKLSGIVTLGTPFISCAGRDLDSAIDSAFTTLAIILIVIFGMLYLFIMLHFFFDNLVGKGITSLGIGIGILLFNRIVGSIVRSLWGMFSEFSSRRLRAFVKTRQQKAARRFFISTSEMPPLLCFSVSEDEASRWLRLLRLICNIGPMISARISPWIPILSWLCFAVLFICISIIRFGGESDLAILALFLLALSVVIPILAALTFIIVQISTIASQRAIRSHRFGFGGESIVDNWFSDISVSDVPVGCTSVTHVVTSASGGLRHSSYYKDLAVARCIAHWMDYVARA